MNKVLLIVAMLLALTACQNDSLADLREFVNSTYKDQRPEIEPLPEVEPYEPYEYGVSAERDPFSMQNIINTKKFAGSNLGGPIENRRKETLEAYPLDALSLVGTIDVAGTPWAIIRSSNGIAHRVKKGNYLGQNNGRIEEVSTSMQKIILSELMLDSRGRWVKKNVEITVDSQ